MIKYNYEVSVNENRAKLNKDIFLFRGNRNIHYYFSIKGARFAFEKEGDLIENANAIYAAVTVIKPNGVEVANAIAPVENGLIHLKVTEDLIDEEVEIGDFDLVFDLFDDSDGAVTIPKIKGQFHVQERPCTTSIGTLSGNVNVVNQAVVDLAIATQENEQLIVVDDDGKYVKTTWVKGDKISIERLNKIEEGIEKNSTQYKNIAHLKLKKRAFYRSFYYVQELIMEKKRQEALQRLERLKKEKTDFYKRYPNLLEQLEKKIEALKSGTGYKIKNVQYLIPYTFSKTVTIQMLDVEGKKN